MSLAKHIAAKRADQQRGFVDVEEWGEGETPLRLFFTSISARDIDKIQRKYKNFLTETPLAAMVEMVIEKCENEKGDKVFTLEDKAILMGESLSVITKVFGAVFNATSSEEHAKN